MSSLPEKKVLDGEFRKILAIIKPFIPCVDNNHYLTMYRIWLEKLSSVPEKDKEERNKYLNELCRQIQNGVLEEPFTEMPVNGILLPFERMLQFAKKSNYVENSELNRPPLLCIEANDKINTNNSETNVINTNINENTNDNNNAIISEETRDDQYTENFQNYSENRSVVLVKPNNGLKKRKPKLSKKNSSTKMVKGHHQKQRSIYVVQKEVHAGPAHFDYTYNLEAVPEEDNSISPQDEDEPGNEIDNIRKYLRQQMKCSKEETLLGVSNSEMDHFMEKLRQNAETSQDFNNNEVEYFNKQKDNDETSWCDFSGSCASLKIESGNGAGDNQIHLKTPLKTPLQGDFNEVKDKDLAHLYEDRISEMVGVINSLRQENSLLNENIQNYERNISLRNKKAELSIHNLSSEVTSLKDRLKELSHINGPSKQNDSHKTSNKLRNSLLMLRSKYETVVNKNDELKETIERLKLKMEEILNEKEKEILHLKNNLEEEHRREVETLKNSQSQLLKDIENTYTQKLHLKDQEIKDKLEEIKHQHEENEAELKEKYKKILQSKDLEINRLENMIQEQCLRMQKEVKLIRNQMEENVHLVNGDSTEKIIFLQKCVNKMEKLFKKSQKEYSKQISTLKREMNFKEKSFELQLTRQRAELLKNSNSFNKAELNNIITDLEERYRNLLENQQTQALLEKEKDMRIISELRERLTKLQSQKNFDEI